MRRAHVAAVAGCAFFLVGAGARTRGMRLDYRRSADVASACPDEETFRQMVAAFARDEVPFKADAADALRVTLERSGGAYRATVAVIGPDGAERGNAEVHTLSNCIDAAAEAASTAYLVVAPLVAPAPEDAPPGPPPTASAPPAAPPPTARTAPPWPPPIDCGSSTRPVPCSLPPLPPPPMDVTIGLSAYAMMTAFLTADVGPAVGLAVDVGGEHVFGQLEFRGVFPGRAYARELVAGATSGFPVEMQISQYTALLVPCARWKYFVGCGVAQFGLFFMEYDLGQAAAPAYAFGPRLGFEIPFAERFAVFGFGEVLFAPSQTIFDFTLGDPAYPDAPVANTQWVQPVASGFFGAGISVKFK